MKILRRILRYVFVLLGIGVAVLAVAISHNSDCAAAPAPAIQGATMKAIVYRCYGAPDVLRYEDVAKPVPADDEVLVKVHAAALNPLDWHYQRGEPYLMRLDSGFGRPKSGKLGVDFAGVVEAVGKNVTRFKPGDAVFGARDGALAEYVSVRESRNIVSKPDNISFREAAAVPVAAVTALQALRDKAQIKAGDKVLINGASGGVGTYAVQIAKDMGAVVTGTTSTRNVEMVHALGADIVVDYKKQDFTQGAERYDAIIDNVGSHSLLAYRKVLQPDGVVVMVGNVSRGKWFGPLATPLAGFFIDPFVSQSYQFILAELRPRDLENLRALLAAGRIHSQIDRSYPLAEAREAMAYLEQGRARGKVIVDVVTP